jgi:hypothetical protein
MVWYGMESNGKTCKGNAYKENIICKVNTSKGKSCYCKTCKRNAFKGSACRTRHVRVMHVMVIHVGVRDYMLMYVGGMHGIEMRVIV